MRKPVVKCLLSIVLSVVFTAGFCVFVNATAKPIYTAGDTTLIYNGGSSFSLSVDIVDVQYFCSWYYKNASTSTWSYQTNTRTFQSSVSVNDIYLRFGLAGFSQNSRDNLTSGNLPVGTVVTYDYSIWCYFVSGQGVPYATHYNGTSTTSNVLPDGVTSSSGSYSGTIEWHWTNQFTISNKPSNLGSSFHFTSANAGGSRVTLNNFSVNYQIPIADAKYCLDNGIITQEQYNAIQAILNPGGSGTDIVPWLEGDSNDYPSVAPDTLPPEVESYDTLFVPEDIDDSQIQSYLDRLDIGSWFSDFWSKMNSINIYLILIVIVLVLIFIRTLFMNFSNFIPK